MRSRDLDLLVGAVGLSALGDMLALVPLALLLQQATGSGFAVAALLIALWAPTALLAGPAGLLADRVECRRLLIGVSLAQAAVAVALAHAEGVVAVLALTTLLGVGYALAQPAEFALVPAAAAGRRIASANGRVETARYVGFTAGPLIGGALAAGGGTRAALLANAGTFAAVALAAALMRARRAPAPRAPGARERARDGMEHILRVPRLARVVIPAVVALLFLTASAAAEVFYARDVLGAGEMGYGAIVSAWTLGMVVGALALAPRVVPAALATGALVALAVQGAGIALPGLVPVLGVALVAFLVGGMAHGAKNVLIRTLFHTDVPERVRGRAFAAYNGARNGAELVALLGGGLLVSVVGARWTLLAAGAVPLAIALAALARRPRAPVPAAGGGAAAQA